MKKEKRYSILFFIASVLFFIAAAIGYANGNSMASCWGCIGATMLCLGSVSLHKTKKEDNKEDKEDKQ